MTDPTDKNEDKSEEGFFMAGFSGATGVPLKQMQDAIAQSTANRLLYVDASLTLANDSSAPKEYEIALSSYVPSGYVIQGVTACVKSGSAYYSLPWTDNGLTQYLNIQRIVGTSVWLRNKSDGWGTVTVRLSVAIGKT